MKKALIAGATVLALVIAAVISLPTFVDLGRFKSIYLPLIEETLQRRVDLDEVRLSLVPTPSIKLSNLNISANSTSPAESFFTAQEVQLRLKLWPLLSGRFEITEFVLDKPVFTLQKASKRSSSSSVLADKQIPANSGAESNKLAPKPKQPDSAAIALTIPRRLRIKNGQLNIITAEPTPVRIHGIELSHGGVLKRKTFPVSRDLQLSGLKDGYIGRTARLPG